MLPESVFITGGTGFVARAYYRRAIRLNRKVRFTALARSDAGIADVMRKYGEADIRFIRADVEATPQEILHAAMAGHDLVIHAAAAKYVDTSEFNAWDTVRVNIIGSQKIALAAASAGVARAICLSTDKAAGPENLYGASKMVMERLWVEADGWPYKTQFVACRYGNVVGSTGSVLHLFKRQYDLNGSVSITDASMTRFWMNIEDALDVIDYATLHAAPASTVIPIPSASDVVTLAKAVTDNLKVPLKVIGIRPGEKLHEMLMSGRESVRAFPPRDGVPYYELRPPGNTIAKAIPDLTSDTANQLSVGELQKMITDAADV